MHISVEINGVETKLTCLSSVAVLIFAVIQLVGIIITFAFTGPDTMPVVDGVLNMYVEKKLVSSLTHAHTHSVLLLAATAGSFLDYPPLKFLVKTHAHRAVMCGVSVYLLLVQEIETRGGHGIVFVVIGTLFFLGHVVASVVSCFQHDKMQESLISQDIRTTTGGATSPDAAVAKDSAVGGPSTSSSSGIIQSAKPGIVETSFNEV